jgi:hypothetical protein
MINESFIKLNAVHGEVILALLSYAGTEDLTGHG